MKNNSHLIMILMAAALLALRLPVAAAAEEKLVFINLDRVFNEYYKTKLADAQLKEQAEEFKEERKKLIDDLQKLQETFSDAREQAQNTALNEEVRIRKRDQAEEKLVEIREQESKIRRFDDSRQKQLDEQSRRMRKRIVDEIREVISTYARSQGYTSVVDSSGESMNLVPIFLYTDAKADITDAVVELLNKSRDTK
jgi:outer membrane protein